MIPRSLKNIGAVSYGSDNGLTNFPETVMMIDQVAARRAINHVRIVLGKRLARFRFRRPAARAITSMRLTRRARRGRALSEGETGPTNAGVSVDSGSDGHVQVPRARIADWRRRRALRRGAARHVGRVERAELECRAAGRSAEVRARNRDRDPAGHRSAVG